MFIEVHTRPDKCYSTPSFKMIQGRQINFHNNKNAIRITINIVKR
jgi:hypothetical protein